MITVEEIHEAARKEAATTINNFAESLESPLRDLLTAAYIAGADHVIKSMLAQPVEEVVDAH